jgi:hypothetical protein
MGLAALEKRVRSLEEGLPATVKECRCRGGQQTMYHNADELKRIMDIRCPVHGFRDLGRLRWVASGLPLQTEDQTFCSCPPCPMREFLLGRRGPLTEVEQADEERKWQRECSAAWDEQFRREQACAAQLLRRYEHYKSGRRRD